MDLEILPFSLLVSPWGLERTLAQFWILQREGEETSSNPLELFVVELRYHLNYSYCSDKYLRG